jgi:hypothetical protein
MLRFNINRDRNYIFVDDVGEDVDCSTLPSDVASVKWTGTDGYLRRYASNLNEPLTDPSPYQSFLNAWTSARLSADVPPTLGEAKAIKIKLINDIFDIKRQAPFHYVIAAGDFMWDADDGAVAGMSIATIPSLLSILTGTSDGTVVGKINALVDEINSKVVAPGNAFENQVNVWIVDAANGNFSAGNSAFGSINGVFGQVNSNIIGPANSFFDHYDHSVLGLIGDPSGGPNTLNNKLQAGTPPNTVAQPGLNAQISPASITLSGIGTNPYTFPYTCTHVYYPTFISIGYASVTPDPSIPPIHWTPIGNASPVTLTAAEMSGLMSSITTRRLNLVNARVTKTNEVNALTNIADVIAYDATAGWPS